MRYLITTDNYPPALTDIFDAENHFNEAIGMIVYDLLDSTYTDDGVNWKEIEIDHL
jgi:hypothetical protein